LIKVLEKEKEKDSSDAPKTSSTTQNSGSNSAPK